MADFSPIETQEQFDAMVKDRLARAEKAAAEKYADYESIKTQNADLTAQNADLTTQIAQLTDQIRQQTETIDGNKTVVDDLTAKVHAYETASVKTKVALELGLPYQMAERLAGSDEDSIRKDAEQMVKMIGSQKPVAPMGSGEPTYTGHDPEQIARAKFEQWFKEF